MPNHVSALKRVRQTNRKSAVNRFNKGVLRASMRQMRKALTSGDTGQILPLVPQALSRIDKAVQKGLIHKNTAGRLKSRLMLRVNKLSQPASQ